MSEPTTNNFTFKQLPKTHIAVSYMVLGFAAFMIWDQIYWWGEREDYSFGYLVPLFAAYVLYDRWPVIRSYLFRGAAPEVEPPASVRLGPLGKALEVVAMAGFMGALLLFAIGALLRSVTTPQNPASLAIAAGFTGIVLCAVFIFSKERADGQPMGLKQRLALTCAFLFPAAIWLISAPLVSVLETKIKVFLLTKVTIVVFNVFDVAGFELEREGNVLILPEGQVGVEEACSGIRSLTACLFAGSFLAAVFLDRFWKKVLLVFAAMCFAVITNLMRSLFLTFWAYNNGSNAINEHWVLPLFGDIGSVHDVTGFAILGLTCVGLMLLLPIFNFKLKEFDDEHEPGADAVPDHTSDAS
ncbi:exosortase/archaeosortase family protein [Coraliomargarita parva]|uniref:exosortase/archaeosortase family protein n=1 Tax=Coraliomargarita parva TaxID=3014050 RepID=UPI0022B554C0|nr:exosortase/archaeosortase family protein [Coraliomargarita parva]